MKGKRREGQHRWSWRGRCLACGMLSGWAGAADGCPVERLKAYAAKARRVARAKGQGEAPGA